MTITYIVLVILSCINIVAFAMYGIDKYRARKQQHRISEATLLGIALAGGALGAWIAMYTFRHKTRHVKFVLLVPLFLAAHIYLIYRLYSWL
ncbi:MAG: DUF1294 domain-containing protein [Bacteroidaceae bacterium]|nr:DUF1294 domain-containing protein [Bacteroidaceae bacterium]